LAVDGGELIALLGDVVVKGEDWASEVEGGIEDVGDVVAEAEVLGTGRGVDSLALGVVGGIDVLLLKCVSFVSCGSDGGGLTSTGLTALRSILQ
jgi:hypothetical protein